MLKINLSHFIDIDAYFYFSISTEHETACISRVIADLFNLNIDLYNQLLIDKVIKHSNYTINKIDKDLTFKLNNISKETYINRFKETFINQLTLITLGGV